MECVALYDFVPTAPDELGFKKNQVLHVLNVSDDKNWCRAEYEGKIGLVPRNYVQFTEISWYRGRIPRVTSEQTLKNPSYPIGSFLVRDSEGTPGGFSLSVKCPESVQHYKILKSPDSRYHIWDEKFVSINSLVAHYRNVSVSKSQNILLVDASKTTESFTVKAAFDFHRQEAGELEFRAGDHITVTECKDKNWWSGTLRGQVGIFPTNYVEIPSNVKAKLAFVSTVTPAILNARYFITFLIVTSAISNQ